MNISRRRFLKGVSAAGVVLAIPFKWVYEQGLLIRYRLYADGVTDDTEAIQALVDGNEPVLMPDGKTVQHRGKIIWVPAGTYRVQLPLKLSGPDKYLAFEKTVRFIIR